MPTPLLLGSRDLAWIWNLLPACSLIIIDTFSRACRNAMLLIPLAVMTTPASVIVALQTRNRPSAQTQLSGNLATVRSVNADQRLGDRARIIAAVGEFALDPLIDNGSRDARIARSLLPNSGMRPSDLNLMFRLTPPQHSAPGTTLRARRLSWSFLGTATAQDSFFSFFGHAACALLLRICI